MKTKNRKSEKFLTRNDGIALFLVLWVLTLLTIIAGEFCHSMRTEINITRNFVEDTEAHYIAKAGITMAISQMLDDMTIRQPSADSEQNTWRVNADIPAFEFARGAFKVRIDNESGKVNINRASGRLLKILLDGFELGDSEKEIILASILDWRDKDRFHRMNGAESDYYLTLSEPYECRNGDFESVEELLLVRGVTKELFYGGLNELTTISGEEITGLEKKTAVPANNDEFDFNNININAASPAMLLCLPQMTEEAVRLIVEYRSEKDFRFVTELAQVVDADTYRAVSPYLSVKKSPFYTIISEGRLADSRTRHGLKAVVEINPKLEKKYRVIQWVDGVDFSIPYNTT